MDIVKPSVKTILLKISWIDLSSLHFSPYLCASLVLPLRALSPLSCLLQVIGSYVGGRFLAFYPNRFVSSEGLHRQCEQESLVGGVEKEPLVSGVAKINTVQEDSMV
jgi:hypothetical protein